MANNDPKKTNQAEDKAPAGTKERIATRKIILHRKGAGRIVVKEGQKFAFTSEELESMGDDAVRKVVNENTNAPAPTLTDAQRKALAGVVEGKQATTEEL